MKRLAVLLFLVGLTLSCATSYYNQAENLVEQGLHQDALREYRGILKMNKQQTGTYTDIRALSGAAASYYELGRYKNVQKLCRLILKLDPKSGGGFYLDAFPLRTLRITSNGSASIRNIAGSAGDGRFERYRARCR